MFEDEGEIFFDGGESFEEDLQAMIREEIGQDWDEKIIGGEDGVEVQETDAWRSVHNDQFIVFLNGADQPPQTKFSRIHRKEGELCRREGEVRRNDIQRGKIGLDDDLLNLLLLNEGIVEGFGVTLVVEPQTLREMSLGIKINHEGPDPHLGQTKTVRGRDGALPCPSLKVEKELPSTGFDRREKSENAPVPHHVLRCIIALLIRIPFRRRKNPFVLFLKKLLL
jgi:hypothetical protein